MATLSLNSEPDPEPVCNNNNDGASVVFIDTNLDTHLAVIVSKNDTVSDLKRRILSEHPLSFPKIGQIQINAIKVKRKGFFYHLSDSMFVRSAFHGFNKSWFLSVDASALEEPGQNKLLCSSGSPYQLACLGNANNALIGPVDIATDGEKEECPIVNPRVSDHTRKESEEDLETGVNHELPSLPIESKVDGSKKGVKDDSNVCEEVSSISVPSAKKRQKSKGKKDAVQDNTSKKKIASVDNLLSVASRKVSSNKFQPLQLENKQDKEKEIPFAIPNVSEHSQKELVKNLETGVKSSANNDPGIPLPGSIPETHCVNLELPSSNIECGVDGSSKGVKDDRSVCGDGTSSVPSAKKKQKSKRKKEDMMQYDTSKENDGSVVGTGNDTVQRVIAVITNPSENADIEVLNETEVVKEHQHTECNNNNMKNDIDTESIKEALEPVHATNKKHGKRKRSLIHDAKEILKAEAISQKVEAEKSDDACKERKESKDQFEINNDISGDDVEYKHNKVTEVVSDIKPPANKKQKRKAKGGDKSSSKRNLSMICDSNVDNVSHQILGVQQKIKISSADQSAEHLNDTDPPRTSEQGGRRKGKKKSSIPHETHVVTSSRKDDEADCSSIQEGVQEEISEDGLISKDITMSKTTLENMEIGADACKESFPSKVKKTGNNKKHCDSDVEVHPSDVNKPKELTEDIVNVALNHGHRSEAGQTEGAEEGRDVLPQNILKLMLLEECTPSNQDNIDANIKELNVTSKVVDVNGMAEPVKSEKKRKRTKKAKDLEGELTLREGICPVDVSESETFIVRSLKSVNCDPASGNTETEENSLNHTEGKYIQQEMEGTVLSATDKEVDFRADNAGSLQQIKTTVNAEHVDKAQRKKSNSKQISTSKSVSSMLTKDEVLNPSPSSDSAAHASPSSKITKKNKSASTKSSNKSSKRNLETSKNLVGLEPSDSQFMSGSNGSSQFPSNTPKGSYNVGPFEANDAAKDSTRSFGEKDDNLEAPSKTTKISADQQFPSEQLQHEANMSDEILVDKMNGSDRQDLDLLTEQNADKHEATKGQIHFENLSSSQQLSSKAEHDVLRTHTDKKVPNGRKIGREAKLSSQSNSDVSSIRDNKKPQVNASGKSMDLKKRREGRPISNSMLEGSKKMVQKKAEASRNNVGGVVGKTQQKKSLLAGAIFKDDSSGTSEDVDEVDNSDASTRTPSDNSLSSDFSDGDSGAGQEPVQNDSHGGRRLENGGRSAIKGNMSSTKGMSIDRILRSSKRYKKAKITASQLEGTESQPELVPDSLA